LTDAVTRTTTNFSGPSQELRHAATQGPAGKQEHDRIASSIEALHSVQHVEGKIEGPAPKELTVASWNLERCKHVEASAALLARTGADVLLLSEMDLGMARSGNRHTTQEVAGILGAGFVFATEYVELGLGDDRETAWHAGEVNEHGLHGNAIVSRYPLTSPARIALDDGGVWYGPEAYAGQRRIGTRTAVSAILETGAGPLLVVALHLESHSSPDTRARQTRRLLDVLARLYPPLPAVIAGDFNTSAFPRGPEAAEESAEWFQHPGRLEPLFEEMARDGFGWLGSNTAAPTIRTLPDGQPRPPFNRIDWIFARGLSTSAPQVWPALDERDSAISDHELLTAAIALT